MAPMFWRVSRGTDLSHGDTALADSSKAVDHIRREMPRAGGRPQCAGGAKARPWAPHPRTTRTSGVPPDLLLLSQRYFAAFRPESSVARDSQLLDRPRCLARACRRQRGPAPDACRGAGKCADICVHIGPKGTSRPCLRAIVGTHTRNHHPCVGGSSPSPGIVVNTPISSVHGRSRTLAA